MKPALAVLLLSWVPAAAAEPRYPVKIEYDQRATMRDGVSLSADVFRPDAPGRVPVILVRTPYDNASPAYARQGLFWASRGYVYLVQDVRGRGESEGEFYPLVHEAEDGYDTQTWCGAAPWSSGKVGTTFVLMDEGHRLRLEISSSAFPKFDRNLNTGGRIGMETKGIAAEQTVYHDREHPSRVLIPVVPR